MSNEQRGIIARMAVHDTALQDAMNELERDIQNEWAACWTQRGRERCHHDLKALKRLRNKLASIATLAPRN